MLRIPGPPLAQGQGWRPDSTQFNRRAKEYGCARRASASNAPDRIPHPTTTIAEGRCQTGKAALHLPVRWESLRHRLSHLPRRCHAAGAILFLRPTDSPFAEAIRPISETQLLRPYRTLGTRRPNGTYVWSRRPRTRTEDFGTHGKGRPRRLPLPHLLHLNRAVLNDHRTAHAVVADLFDPDLGVGLCGHVGHERERLFVQERAVADQQHLQLGVQR